MQQVLSDRYVLERLIGSGGMADVWLARDRALGREVAIKLLHSGYAADPLFVERFRREAQSAARLSHPNIAGVYDWGEISGPPPSYFIVMEYVPGENLREVISRRGPLPESDALGIGAQVAAALEDAHRHGIVHRDVKPHNILLTPDGQVKVVDFGIAHAAGASQLTQTGSVSGTAQYLSPEQAQRLPIDGRSDLYSLGVVLYEMVAGRPPFTGSSLVDVALRHVREPAVPPRAIRPDLSPTTDAAVMQALSKDPAQRFVTAAEMRRALLAAAQQVDTARAPTAQQVVVEQRASPARAQGAEQNSRAVAVQARAPRRRQSVQAPPRFSGWLLLVPLLLLVAIGGVALARYLGSPQHHTTSPPATATHHARHNKRTGAKPAGSAHPTATIATPAATSAPAVSAPNRGTEHGASTPNAAVLGFYVAAAYHRFAAAQALWSPRMVRQYPPATYIVQRFTPTTYVTLTTLHTVAQSQDHATVAVALTEDQVGGKVNRFTGTWELVRGQGGWLLDAPHLSGGPVATPTSSGPPHPPGQGPGEGKAKDKHDHGPKGDQG